MEFWIFGKPNNSIATIFLPKFTKQPLKLYNIFKERHNAMTELCRALSKCENNNKISWEK